MKTELPTLCAALAALAEFAKEEEGGAGF